MKNQVFICSLLILTVTAVMIKSEDAIAGGNSACPAFTTEMVDAAAMAFGLTPDRAVTISVGDDPSVPTIYCNIVGAPSIDRFDLEVNSSMTYVYGGHRAEEDPPLDFSAELFSYGEQLSVSQMHACRSAILRSFVWRNYCAPALP